MSDARFSITLLRVGSAAGVDGPLIILTKGESLEFRLLSNIVKNYGCPPGSCVIPTPTAYMTDEVWLKILPSLLKGSRQMEGIHDYPEFKAMLSFDG